MNSASRTVLNRRQALAALALGTIGATLPRLGTGAQVAETGHQTLVAYLESHARPDGGYGWEDQPHSHLTPTFAVIGSYRCLGLTPPNPKKLAEYVRDHHPSLLKKLEQEHREFEYEQIQSLLWLGEDPSVFRKQVAGWRAPTAYLKQYERHGYPILDHEVTAFTCRALLGMPLTDLAPEYVAYLDSRRRANGSFNNTPTSDGGDGHVLNTWWGLQGMQVLGRKHELRTETVEWLRACQRPNGGFTWQPKPAFAGVDDVAYTWAAVRSLQLLEAAPANRDGCVEYLLSLGGSDGGFGDRPGWRPNPRATYYALESLRALDALGLPRPSRSRPAANAKSTAIPEGLEVFSIQLEAHGKGSPDEAVQLAQSLSIQLWGAKNASPAWIAKAQELAIKRNAPARFFIADEEYGTWVDVPGLGTYSHTSDIMAPAGANIGASLANQGVVTWPEFRRRRLDPLQKSGGRLVWQFGENEALTRLFLDDSLERGGYAAISTFHFGNPDFTNSEPFLQRYRGKIPFVALQDAHGDEPWWFADMTTGFRTLFLGKEPTWEAWLEALERNWVVPVRHDAVSGFQTWMHAGSPEVLAFAKRHEASWRWWDSPAIQRPLVSLVAITAQDEFEVARPKSGVTLRVRCAWENTAQGRPRKAIAELVKLTLDGQQFRPTLVAPAPQRGAGLLDHYHFVELRDLPAGKHEAIAVARVLETGQMIEHRLQF